MADQQQHNNRTVNYVLVGQVCGTFLLGIKQILFREGDEVEAEKCVKNHYVKIQSKGDHQSWIGGSATLNRYIISLTKLNFSVSYCSSTDDWINAKSRIEGLTNFIF